MVWTIEGEEVIRLGDSTTHGGKVLSASLNSFYEEIPIARVGDLVSCPKCKGTHTIVSGDPHTFDDGKPIARNGDLVSCGAKLIARSALVSAQEQASFSGPNNKQGPYDEQVQIVDEKNGEPLTSYPFYIEVSDGQIVSGKTDANGCAPRIYTAVVEKLNIWVGEEAEEKMEENRGSV